MKMKYLIIVGLILAILTMGAVSASEDVALDDVSANDEGVDVEEAPAEDVTDEIIGTEYDGDSFYVDIDEEADINEDEDVIDVVIYDEDVEGNFSISVKKGDDSWQIDHLITDEDIEDDCAWSLNDLKIYETGIYFIDFKFIPTAGDEITLLENCQLEVIEGSYEPPTIEFNEEFFIDDVSFVVVQLPWDTDDGRIIVYVDDVESFNETLDKFDPYTAGDGSMLAYVVGFKNLTCEKIEPGYYYNFKVEVYVDGNIYASEETMEYINSDVKEEVDYDYDVPERVRMDSEHQYIYICILDSDITGNVTITIGGKLFYNQEITYYYDESEGYVGNELSLYGLNLTQGEYDVVISYAGDDKYEGFTIEEELFYYFIDEDNYGDIYRYFSIDIVDDATGIVELLINGTSFINLTASELISDNLIDLLDLPYGKYNYTIKYSGDEKYTLEEPVEGEFERTYRFYVNLEDWYDETIYVGGKVTFEINTPSDEGATVVIRYNGKVTNLKVYDSEMYYSISDWTLGENVVYFTYVSDKYPEKTVNMTIDVEPKVNFPSEVRYGNEEDAISILLPEDAVGNMVIYREGKYDETIEGYEWDVLATVPVKDGKANYTVDLRLGCYIIRVLYDGDDYEDCLDELKYISVIPDIDVPKIIYINASNNITVVLPDDGEDNLTVSIYDGYDDDIIYNAVANGTVIIPIPKLRIGDYYRVTVMYGDYSDTYNLDVRGTPPEFELEVIFPTELVNEDNEIKVSGVPKYSDKEGDLVLYIDGKFEDYLSSISYIYYSHYSYGYHTWEIRYEGDPYYYATPKSGEFFVDWIRIPSSFEEDDIIELDLDGKEGYVDFIVDGKSYETVILDDGYGEIIMKGLDYGHHTYEISYYDTNNVKQLTKSGTFNYTFFMYSNIDEYSAYYWMSEFELIIKAPKDITENITVNVDGKIYNVKPVNGTATVLITDLVAGANNVTVSYPGDAKYAAKEFTNVLYISEEYSVCDNWEAGYQKLISFSISLPKNATGNLSVYSGDYDVDKGWSNEILIKSVPLVNGAAVVYIDDILKFGQYHLKAIYESEDDDYHADYTTAHIAITPDVNITDAVVGDNATIRTEMPNAVGVINVYMWIDYKWELKYTVGPVDDGIFEVNVTGLPLGSYSFKLVYVGDDYTNPFVEYDDYFEPIVYYLQITPSVINIPENFTEDGSGEITLELPEGSAGKVTVYDFNRETGNVKCLIDNETYTSENKSLPISGLSAGRHYISVTYVDDNGGMFAKDAMVLVPKSDKGADITIPETITGDSFDVTLPSDATGAIIVNIDGTNTYIPLVNGTAKVDVSNLSEGSHNITIKYAGDAKYKGFEKTATVNISKKQPAPTPATVPAKIVAKDLIAFYNKVSYSVTVYGTDGKVAKGVTVVFKIDGKKVGTAKTNAKGIATIILKQVPKTYKITSTALGKSVTKKLTVKQVLTLKKAKVKKSAKKVVLTATLKEGKKAIKGKKITFKFNGKKVKTVKTNKKGVAKVKVKKSLLKKLKVGKKVKYQATYLKDTVKKSVKVKK